MLCLPVHLKITHHTLRHRGATRGAGHELILPVVQLLYSGRHLRDGGISRRRRILERYVETALRVVWNRGAGHPVPAQRTAWNQMRTTGWWGTELQRLWVVALRHWSVLKRNDPLLLLLGRALLDEVLRVRGDELSQCARSGGSDAGRVGGRIRNVRVRVGRARLVRSRA